jgi:hypothetical protein
MLIRHIVRFDPLTVDSSSARDHEVPDVLQVSSSWLCEVL